MRGGTNLVDFERTRESAIDTKPNSIARSAIPNYRGDGAAPTSFVDVQNYVT